MLTFPEDFTWGVATSSFQAEGGARADGKGPSIWDLYVHQPGNVVDGATADVAIDSYHRYRDDIRCMQDLGVGAYRFSLSWPRLIPDGSGPLNGPGVDYYNALIDGLLEAGITPFVTLYHWDLPVPLHEQGGWREREMAHVFADYAGRMIDLFGDRVKHWITFNEIHAFVDQGYGGTSKAPGLDLGHAEVAQVYLHVLLAQGLAVRAMRAKRSGLSIGNAENPRTAVPLIETEDHVQAASRAFNEQVGFLFEPAFHGRYPAEMREHPSDICNGDMETIRCDLDFLGLNIYTGRYVEPVEEAPGYRFVPMPEYHPAAPTERWLKILPEAMYWGIRTSVEKYAPDEIYIMESGFPLPEQDPEPEGADLPRMTYLRPYLQNMHRAVQEGYPVRGYFYWSLMDNFEWRSGFTSRFGHYHTDFETLQRSPRRSAKWYSEIIRRNAIC